MGDADRLGGLRFAQLSSVSRTLYICYEYFTRTHLHTFVANFVGSILCFNGTVYISSDEQIKINIDCVKVTELSTYASSY